MSREAPQHRIAVAGYGSTGGVLVQLVQRLEDRHPSTYGHSHRVAAHARAIAAELGLAAATAARVQAGALLHDVGKTRIPKAIVGKPGRLDGDEYAEIRRHAEVGAAMVAPLGDPALTAIVRHHHERFDGEGYPAGLHSYEIPLGARIVAVADTFDALTSPRPYRRATTEERALEMLEEAAGTQLDPTVVRVALRLAGRRQRRPRHGRFGSRPGSGAAAAPAPRLRPLAG